MATTVSPGSGYTVGFEQNSYSMASLYENYDKHYKELYPKGVDLRPGTEVHEKLKGEILRRALESERELKKRHPSWNIIDRSLTLYIDHTEAEKARDERRPVPIVVPETFSIVETILTYFTFVFGESPTFRYENSGPEDVIGALLLEKLIETHVQKSKMLLELNTIWRDAVTYGFGVGALSWRVETGKVADIEDSYILDPSTFQPVVVDSQQVFLDAVLYEGNELQAVDPRCYLPDPTVSIYKVQDGEYVGFKETSNYMSMLRDEAGQGSQLMNVRYLKDVKRRSQVYFSQEDERNAAGFQFSNAQQIDCFSSTHPIDVIWMYIDIIPKNWMLGDSELPEKWLFGLAADTVIVAAHPMNLNHNKFPIAVVAPDAGGHELMPIARAEVVNGMQRYMNFLINARMQEIRRFLVNRLLVDPKLVNMWDVVKGRPAIRMRKPIWGRGVQNAIEQIKMQDVTSGHMGDLGAVTQMMRNASGAVDFAQGIQRQRGERVTAEEFGKTSGQALSRLQRMARMMSLQGHTDLGYMMAFHAQQFMTQGAYVKTVGRLGEVLSREYGQTGVGGMAYVDPLSISIPFDVIVSDGSLTGAEDVDGWMQFLQIIAGNPAMGQGYDMVRIGLHVARQLGAKNVEDFRAQVAQGGMQMQPQVMPDAQVQDMAASGQLEAV